MTKRAAHYVLSSRIGQMEVHIRVSDYHKCPCDPSPATLRQGKQLQDDRAKGRRASWSPCVPYHLLGLPTSVLPLGSGDFQAWPPRHKLCQTAGCWAVQEGGRYICLPCFSRSKFLHSRAGCSLLASLGADCILMAHGEPWLDRSIGGQGRGHLDSDCNCPEGLGTS